LNEVAPLNISDIVVTAEVFQFPIGWLKEDEFSNMDCMLTLAVVIIDQLFIEELPPLLNAIAETNIAPNVVTPETSHAPIS
jgi:hypothetical protein